MKYEKITKVSKNSQMNDTVRNENDQEIPKEISKERYPKERQINNLGINTML